MSALALIAHRLISFGYNELVVPRLVHKLAHNSSSGHTINISFHENFGNVTVFSRALSYFCRVTLVERGSPHSLCLLESGKVSLGKIL